MDDKAKKLNLTEERKEYLRKSHIKDVKYNEADWDVSFSNICTDKIVAIARPLHAENWLDELSDNYCHKNKNFNDFEISMFSEFLLREIEPNDGYPEVIEINNEYYIDGNGLHRLTIAKCIGGLNAKVVVKKYKC